MTEIRYNTPGIYTTPGIYNPPICKYELRIEVPINAPKNLGEFIGPNGRILKAMTHQSGVLYIWCSGKYIEIFGNDMDKIQDAIRRIRERCDYLQKRKEAQVEKRLRQYCRHSHTADDFLVHTEHCLRGAACHCVQNPRGPLCPMCETKRTSPCPCDDCNGWHESESDRI